jgi:hypothetical protein
LPPTTLRDLAGRVWDFEALTKQVSEQLGTALSVREKSRASADPVLERALASVERTKHDYPRTLGQSGSYRICPEKFSKFFARFIGALHCKMKAPLWGLVLSGGASTVQPRAAKSLCPILCPISV